MTQTHDLDHDENSRTDEINAAAGKVATALDGHRTDVVIASLVVTLVHAAIQAADDEDQFRFHLRGAVEMLSDSELATAWAEERGCTGTKH